MIDADYEVVFCSGRTAGSREATASWIERVFVDKGFRWEDAFGRPLRLFMREVGDRRKDAVVKRELFDAYIRESFDVAFVLDDRQQVVDAWREIGLTVFQVAPGDF